MPELNDEYIERMNDLLELYERPLDTSEPVVCIDERPVVLHDSYRPSTDISPGKTSKMDYEYVRCGTANIFGIIEPKTGQHFTYATENRKKPAFGQALKNIADAYPEAKVIHLVMDNLNTHTMGSLLSVFDEETAINIWSRFKVHYTPKHGSWLNQAEIELSLWSRQCLGKRRIPMLSQLQNETKKWVESVNRNKIAFKWRFSVMDAKKIFDYK